MPESSATLAAERPGGVVTCGRLRAWVMTAQPNARIVYGRGRSLLEACSAELGAYVFALYELGYLTPHFVRGTAGELPFYLAQRTARVVPPGTRL